MKKQAFYTLVRQLREVEQQFTQFEWQLTRLEPEEFARQWEDNTHKLEGGDKGQKNVTRPSDEPPSGCLEFHAYRVELERRRRLQ